jgi:hypothetical protein
VEAAINPDIVADIECARCHQCTSNCYEKRDWLLANEADIEAVIEQRAGEASAMAIDCTVVMFSHDPLASR